MPTAMTQDTQPSAAAKIIPIGKVDGLKSYVDLACLTEDRSLLLIGWFFDPNGKVRGLSMLQEEDGVAESMSGKAATGRWLSTLVPFGGRRSSRHRIKRSIEHGKDGVQLVRVSRPDVANAMGRQSAHDKHGFILVVPVFPPHGKIAQDWHAVRDGVEAKQCTGPDGAEPFVLIRSVERREKERAMHARFTRRIEDGLARLGRRLQRARRAAGRYLIELIPAATVPAGVRLEWTARPEWDDWPRWSEGCYVLRTNIADWSAEDLWHTYIQLTQAEAAFRIHKSDLSLRPIWHQKSPGSRRTSSSASSPTCS